jgi:hypothetical protein
MFPSEVMVLLQAAQELPIPLLSNLSVEHITAESGGVYGIRVRCSQCSWGIGRGAEDDLIDRPSADKFALAVLHRKS